MKKNLLIILLIINILLPVLTHAADWTVMIYMCADNSMNDQSYEDINEMLQVGSTEDVNILVQVDNIASSLEPDCRRYLIHNNTKELLINLGEVDMADPQTLIDFVRFSKRNFESDNYILILWDHGNGWPVGYYNCGEKAIIHDQSSGNWIGIADGELKYAVNEIKQILRKKLTIIGFDACLMSMAEIASELTNDVDIMLASEEVTPWDGFPYDEILSIIVNQTSLPPIELSKKIIEQIALSYNNGSQGYEPCTYSAIDLRKFNDAQNNFIENINILNYYANTTIMREVRDLVQTFSIENNPPNKNDDYIDLLHLLSLIVSRLSNTDEIVKIENTLDLLQKSVIVKKSVGVYLQNAHGIAVWFPDNYISFKKEISDYEKLVWHEKTKWLSFLNDFYDKDDIKPTPAQVTNSNVNQNNDYYILWTGSNDLSTIRYDLIETKAMDIVMQDNFDSLDLWFNQGFSLSTQNFHSAPTSLYSTSDNNLNNQLTLIDSISLQEAGTLSFWAYYKTEESYYLSSGYIKRDLFYIEISENGNDYSVLDSFYGKNLKWTEHRYFISKSDKLWIRLRYKTDASVTDIGVYIDDLVIYNLDDTRYIVLNYPDTSYYLFNIPRSSNYYIIKPIDSFGNVGFISIVKDVIVDNYCSPFSLPSPFLTECKIYCDFPVSEHPDLYIYTIAGELVKKINYSLFNKDTVFWNGMNHHGKTAGTGLYIVMLKSPNFKRLGKIVKVK